MPGYSALTIEKRTARTLCASLFLLFAAAPVKAEGTSEGAAIALELNKVEDTGTACRFSFVLSNQTGEPADTTSYELVLFSTDGVISQMSVFDFGSLPVGKTVVRQFELPGSCQTAGRLLINGPAGCQSDRPSVHCSAPLSLSSRTSQDLTQ